MKYLSITSSSGKAIIKPASMYGKVGFYDLENNVFTEVEGGILE